MIECQYCYTRNRDDAPTCQACGGPLSEPISQGLLLVNGITEEQFKEALHIWLPSPRGPNKFVEIGVIG